MTLIERLIALPIYTEILNVDTGKTGSRHVKVPIGLRDGLAAEITRLRGLLGEAGVALVEAIIGVGDDYMTSEAHHPDYVLIPVAKFDQLVAAEEALKRGDIRAETGGGEDE